MLSRWCSGVPRVGALSCRVRHGVVNKHNHIECGSVEKLMQRNISSFATGHNGSDAEKWKVCVQEEGLCCASTMWFWGESVV